MTRPPLVRLALGLALLLVCPVGAQARQPAAQPGGHLSATLSGRPIDLSAVGRFHCHDLAYPEYRCFRTAAQRNRDIAAPGRSRRTLSSDAPTALLGIQAVTYVLAYEHIDFGGSSLAISVAVSDLGALNWNDRISSFKSTNGGRPKWWDGTSYTGMNWRWGTSVWVSNLVDYGANDRFSSLKNVP